MNRSVGRALHQRHRTSSFAFVLVVWAFPICAAEIPPLDIHVVSAKEIVFNWKRDRCDDKDIPDSALKVYRRDDGHLIGLATHWQNRLFLIGPDRQFKRDCRIVFSGSGDPNPAAYDDKIWIVAPWTVDGRTVYALGHNEYQGETHPGRCTFKSYQECWYNSIVLLKSNDGGRSFARIYEESPMAGAAFRYEQLQGMPRGFFGPTNVLRDGDYLYTIIFTTGGDGQKRGNCLFRTRSFSDANSWEYWTGTGFYPSRSNPYARPVEKVPGCEPLPGLAGRVWSIRRYRQSGLFLATVGIQSPDTATGTIGISASTNLKEWSPPYHLFSVSLIWSRNCKDTIRYSYPSLIDLNSTDRNFSDIGDLAEIYMTEPTVANCGATLDRNLVRYSISVTVPESAPSEQRSGSK